METLDARGLSYLEPVVMMRQAMASGEAEYTMLVDAAAARENVTRFAEHQGYAVSVAEHDDATDACRELYRAEGA